MDIKGNDFNAAYQEYVNSPINRNEKKTVEYFLRNKLAKNNSPKRNSPKKNSPKKNSPKKMKNKKVNFIDNKNKEINIGDVKKNQVYKKFNFSDYYDNYQENDEKVVTIEESDSTVKEHCTCNIY